MTRKQIAFDLDTRALIFTFVLISFIIPSLTVEN